MHVWCFSCMFPPQTCSCCLLLFYLYQISVSFLVFACGFLIFWKGLHVEADLCVCVCCVWTCWMLLSFSEQQNRTHTRVCILWLWTGICDCDEQKWIAHWMGVVFQQTCSVQVLHTFLNHHGNQVWWLTLCNFQINSKDGLLQVGHHHDHAHKEVKL